MSFNVGTAKIYEVFGLAGKIVWMDLHMDKEGRSKVRSFASSDNEISKIHNLEEFIDSSSREKCTDANSRVFMKLSK